MADTIIDGTLLNTSNLMYTKPKANEKGGKSLTILNKTTKTGLRISTPLMLTWGATDFVDSDGNGNGKYEMSLQFPSDEYTNDDCESFLKNMKKTRILIFIMSGTCQKCYRGRVPKPPVVM